MEVEQQEAELILAVELVWVLVVDLVLHSQTQHVVLVLLHVQADFPMRQDGLLRKAGEGFTWTERERGHRVILMIILNCRNGSVSTEVSVVPGSSTNCRVNDLLRDRM